MSSCLVLTVYIYILVYFLDFVIVLFQKGVFEYIDYWFTYLGVGAVVHICKPYLCTPIKLPWAAKNEIERDVWEYQRFPLRLLSRMNK